jgi:hypothetical protein
MPFKVELWFDGTDELCVSVGERFWFEWFPCTKQEVWDDYDQTVRGILSGRMRVLEYIANGEVYRADLQEPKPRGGWATVAHYHFGCLPHFGRSSRRILQALPP